MKRHVTTYFSHSIESHEQRFIIVRPWWLRAHSYIFHPHAILVTGSQFKGTAASWNGRTLGGFARSKLEFEITNDDFAKVIE
jgi:hypothetical protein